MRLAPTLLAAVALSVPLVTPATAQEDPAAAGVRATVDRLFDAMRAADADAVTAVFAHDARLTQFLSEGTGSRIAYAGIPGFAEAVGASGGTWDEQIYDVEVRVDRGVASVWAPFTFYLDGELSHCGANSIELLLDITGWKITQISDSRVTLGCPDPLGVG